MSLLDFAITSNSNDESPSLLRQLDAI